MGIYLSEPAPGKSDLTAKNRVWGFFANPNRTRQANRQNPQQPRRKNRPTPTKTASGIPYWPSRDPIEEEGGMNLFVFTSNAGVNSWDYLGLIEKLNQDDCEECEAVRKQMSSDPLIKRMIEEMKEAKCPMPRMLCECKDMGNVQGEWFENFNFAYIYCKRDWTAEDYKTAFIHEFTHAWEQCVEKLDPFRSCKRVACSEIKAYCRANCRHEADKRKCVKAHILRITKEKCMTEINQYGLEKLLDECMCKW